MLRQPYPIGKTYSHPTRPTHETHGQDRVTATEMIDGTLCQVVLEQDRLGKYRETSVQPIAARGPYDHT